LTILVLCVPIAAAQQPPAQPPATPNPRLNELLQHWEREAVQTTSLYARLRQSRKNPVFPNAPPETKEGWAKFMKFPDGGVGAHLYLVNPQNPNDYDRIVFTGTYIYQFRPQDKTVNVIPIQPQKAGKAPDDGPLPFLFGMKAETATKRYQLTILSKPKDAEWYTHVQVIPNFGPDQQDFQRAEVAILNKDTQAIPKDMPKRIFYVEPNNVQVSWDIDEIQRNPIGKIQRIDFAAPDVPKGWEKVIQPVQPPPGQPTSQPRVIRNQSPN
jgi:TIGR03009 family protein